MLNVKMNTNINIHEKIKNNTYLLNDARMKTECARERLKIAKEEVIKAVEALNFLLMQENEILEESNKSLFFLNNVNDSSFSSNAASAKSLLSDRHCDYTNNNCYAISNISPIFTSKGECALGGFSLGEFKHHTPDKGRNVFVGDDEKTKRFKI